MIGIIAAHCQLANGMIIVTKVVRVIIVGRMQRAFFISIIF